MTVTMDEACRFLLHNWNVLIDHMRIDLLPQDEDILIRLKDALDSEKTTVRCVDRYYRVYRVLAGKDPYLYHSCHPKHLRKEIIALINGDIEWNSLNYAQAWMALENIKKATTGIPVPLVSLSTYDKEKMQKQVDANGGWWVCGACGKVFPSQVSFTLEAGYGNGRRLANV